MDRYELVSSAVVADVITITKYKSKDTGLNVCLANIDGPVVNGYFCLATEAHDDDGLPHTLEHLIFLGSEEYPYKGMLDQFANRCLATGTNAWTDTDHTAYTINTAGSEGFLNIASIFLDHIIYPTITESGYTTEVHHVNGEGEDSGIVYCEMQARENLEHSLAHYTFLQCMYPGVCGYKSETGGIMKNLRESCSYEKVRNYHKSFYRPDNLCLIVTGNVDANQLFDRLKPFEEKILSKGPLPPLTRPWTSSVPPLDDNLLEESILFSTEDESTGSVKMGWRGPNINDHYECDAVRMLLKYLTETSVAPLQQALVEIDEPLCADVDGHLMENRVTNISIDAEAVVKEHLNVIKEEVLSVLMNIASGQLELDMDRFVNVIHKAILEEKLQLENSPHDAIAFLAIADFLYSDDNQLQQRVNKIARLTKLKEEKEVFWLALLKRYMTEAKMVVVKAEPSIEKMKTAGEEEKNRIVEQRVNLGEDGLKKKAGVVEDAVEKNGVAPDPAIISTLPIPSVDKIKFHDIKSTSNRSKHQCDNIQEFQRFTTDGLPCAFHVLHSKSLFTMIYVVADTSVLGDELRMYLPLFADVLFESPILKDGVVISYEDVVTQLEADTITYCADVGEGGGSFSPTRYSSLFTIKIKVENEKYDIGVQWLNDLMVNLQFTAERLKSASNKIINSVAGYKRRGQSVLKALHQSIDYVKESNFYACNMIKQHAFLRRLVTELDTSPDKIIADMETLRRALFVPVNLRYFVSTNLNNLPENADQVWRRLMFMDVSNVVDKVQPIPRDIAWCSSDSGGKAKAVGVGSVDSAYMSQNCNGVSNFNHPDYPAMLVFVEYLCALEGPLWQQIRGIGLSYNYTISVEPNSGKLCFGLAKSTQIFEAYLKAKEIVEGYVSGSTLFEIGPIEAARSGVLFEIISGEESLPKAAKQHIYAEFMDVDTSFCRMLLTKVSNVSESDLKRVAQQYFINLFDPSEASISLCCHPTKVDEVVKSFGNIGVNFEIVTSLESEFQEIECQESDSGQDSDLEQESDLGQESE